MFKRSQTINGAYRNLLRQLTFFSKPRKEVRGSKEVAALLCFGSLILGAPSIFPHSGQYKGAYERCVAIRNLQYRRTSCI